MSHFNLSALAVRERSITLFLIVAIILSGAYAFLRLGRAEDPSFLIKTLTVTAVWPGATAQEMQDLVAEPLEKRMQELRWYDRVESFTRPGIAVMMITLSDKTPPPAVARSSIRRARSSAMRRPSFRPVCSARLSTTSTLMSSSLYTPSRPTACHLESS